jgi:hypothetical protein
MNHYAFILKDRHTQEGVFEGEVEVEDEDETYEMAKSQIEDKDMLASLIRGDLILAFSAI